MYTFRRHVGGGGISPQSPMKVILTESSILYDSESFVTHLQNPTFFFISLIAYGRRRGKTKRCTLFYQFWSVLKEDCGYILTWLPSDLDENPARGCGCCCCCCCCCWGLNQLRIEPSCPNTGQTSKLESQKILWKIGNSVNCLDGSKSNKFSRKYPSVIHIGTGSHM